MSKAAKISIFLLIAVIVAFGALSFLTLQQNTQLSSEKTKLQEDLEAADAREIESMRQLKDLGDQVKKAEVDKADLGKKLKETKLQSDELAKEVKKITEDRDTWKRRIDKISKERDSIKGKVDQYKKQVTSLNARLSQKDAEIANARKAASTGGAPEATPTSQRNAQTRATSRPMPTMDPAKMGNDEYWAAVLTQKAELEIEMGKLDDELAKKSIEVVEMRRQNEDLTIEIEEQKSLSETLNDEIKYKSELVNNLSLELARTKNDRKFVSEKLKKLNEDNAKLRRDMRSLVSAKGALQKSIVRLTQDKNKVEKELGTTESIIQSKIDEIWEIKDSLDQTFQDSANTVPTSNDIELPPIHVNSTGSQVPYDLNASMPGFNGRVVSINEENNFVIVDIGQAKGIQMGEALSVYRENKYIARLEVMQVRNDISAADVRDQWSRIQVGDIVR